MEDPARPCTVCSTIPLTKMVFMSHLLGKKHLKKSKARTVPVNVIKEKSVHVTGLPKLFHSAMPILNKFWKFEIVDAVFLKKFGHIEFRTKEGAQNAMKEVCVIEGQNLKVSPFNAKDYAPIVGHGARSESSTKLPPLTPSLEAKMEKKEPSASVLHDLILELVREIELKPKDYAERDKLKFVMETFLKSMFPSCKTYTFGSSSNGLGFAGCDVDMVANLGVDVWGGGSREKAEQRAADLTVFLAKEIRKRKRGYNVVPISRARVPIVKFEEASSHLEVDLSFKNIMPLYNTRLIKEYTEAHAIVRPYLMLLRYWAKVQRVAGGAQPNTLLTNYCYCMMMLFWLMLRKPQIVPPIGELQLMYNMRNGNRTTYIDGWNCSFVEMPDNWKNAYHNTSILELTTEFFEFYSQFDSKEWVICPLAGILIKKKDIRTHKPSSRQVYMDNFYFYKIGLDVRSPLCVQDPFEMCNNISRGLKEGPMALFQLKCNKAAKICRKMRTGEASLADLLTPYDIEEGELDMDVGATSVIDETECEIVSNCSEDSIELLQELESLERNGSFGLKKLFEEKGDGHVVMEEDGKEEEGQIGGGEGEGGEEEKVEKGMGDTSGDEIVLLGEVSPEEKTKEVELVVLDECQSVEECESDDADEKKLEHADKSRSRIVEFVDIDDSDSNHSLVEQLETFHTSSTNDAKIKAVLDEQHKFKFDFSFKRLFEVHPDGTLNLKTGVPTSLDAQDKCTSHFVLFILEHCCKCEILESEFKGDEKKSELLNVKRKQYESQEESPNKFLKANDGHGKQIDHGYILLSKHKCSTRFCIWEDRKKTLKKVDKTKLSPLQCEVVVSDVISKQASTKPLVLDFETSLWRDLKAPNTFWVTCNTCSSGVANPKEHNMFKNFFSFYNRLSKNLVTLTSPYI